MKKLALSTAIAAALSLGAVLNTVSADDEHSKMMTYHVTITNATVNHKLTPPIVIAHKKGFKLFTLGDTNHPASAELAELAETGSPAALAASLSDNPMVSAIATGDGVIHGGIPYTIEIIAPRNTHFTVASMLATTNDAFTAVVNVKAPKRSRTTSAMGMTYDAGSEKNNEDCAYIPGPPCGGAMNKNEMGEGFVTMHSGISGKGDLMPNMFDWRGATSMVSIHNAGRYKGY